MGYTAVVLEKTSIQLLTYAMRAVANLEEKEFFLKTSLGDTLPHHMTINLNEFDLSLNHETVIHRDTFAHLVIDSLHWSSSIGAAAFRVKKPTAFGQASEHTIRTINDKNSCAHVTVALRNGVKAFHSNDLFADPPEDLIIHEFDDCLICSGRAREIR